VSPGNEQDDLARRAVESAAHTSYGRLVAHLGAGWRDLQAAQDAVAEAFAAALRMWPVEGVPLAPEAWLLAVARRRMIDAFRRSRVRLEHEARVAQEESPALPEPDPAMSAAIPDERLGLLFVCAHPAIEAAIRTPLMLQTVLGLDAARIAAAFAEPPGTMSQRLVRAKTKIRDAGIPFRVPEVTELPARLDAVLEAVYAAFGTGWDEVPAADGRGAALTTEALRLGRLLVELLPEAAEARGLLALMLHCEARRPARRDANGRYVPVAEQDVRRWSAPLQQEAEAELARASAAGELGRFQLEAAIQSVHAARAHTGRTDWPMLVQLYTGLLRVSPALGAQLGRVASLLHVRGAAVAWERLEALPARSVETHQPYWALRAHLLRQLGRTTEAWEASLRAEALTHDPAVRAYLAAQRTGGEPGEKGKGEM
jgi:predicted RNA polymerase sigma factor